MIDIGEIYNVLLGRGSKSVYHLSVNSFYWGRLRWSEFVGQGWVFDPTPKTQDLVSLAEFFGDLVYRFEHQTPHLVG